MIVETNSMAERALSQGDRDMEPEIGNFETEMNRGFLQILVLALLEKEMYGYSMVRTIQDLGYDVEENTLYPLLRRLEKNGWVRSKWDVSEDRPRKFYAITDEGRTLRTQLLAIWKKQDEILKHLMEEKSHV
jgi:PadR family transcriptional regulator, regulatory protein PadR